MKQELFDEIDNLSEEEAVIQEECKRSCVETEEFKIFLDRLNNGEKRSKVESFELARELTDWSAKIETEFKFYADRARKIYAKRFPELVQVVPDRELWVKTADAMGNDYLELEQKLTGTVNNQLLSTILVIANATAGVHLTQGEYSEFHKFNKQALELVKYRKVLVDSIDSITERIAPNLTILLGSNLASRLIIMAGGLDKLAIMPACNIQVAGKNEANNLGFSNKSTIHKGIIASHPLVLKAPLELHKQVCRLLAAKTALAARSDAFDNSSDLLGKKRGESGKAYLEEIEGKIEKLKNPNSERFIKPLPKPLDKPSKKRGGKNARRIKAKYETTAVREARNKMAFGKAEEEFESTGSGFGLLGVETVRGEAKKNNFSRKLEIASKEKGNGMTSNFAFTPYKEAVLVDQSALSKPKQAGIFDERKGFVTVKKNKSII